jgi:sodium/bile acid cotransporter 7
MLDIEYICSDRASIRRFFQPLSTPQCRNKSDRAISIPTPSLDTPPHQSCNPIINIITGDLNIHAVQAVSNRMEPPHPRHRVLKRIVSLVLHQWLLIGIGVVCALAYCFPNVAKHGGVIRSEYSIMYGVIAIIFLISGLSIPRQKLFSHFLNWRLHLLVQVVSFLFIPALVLAVVHVILAGDPAGNIDRAVLAGYIFTACIPTTIASNVVMTRAAGGDDAAALVEVLLANVLGPFVTAAWTVSLIPKTAEFDPWRYGGGSLGSMYKDVFQQLGLSVLLPLFVGQLVRWTWPDRTASVLQKTKLPKLATVCMLLLIW